VGVHAGNAVVTLDVASGALTTLGHERSVDGVAVAPDGRSVYASSLDDQAVVRWGLESGAFWRGFRVAPAGQGTLVVSPGGRDLVGTLSGVQGLNGVGHVWDLRTGRPVGGPITAGRGGIGWLAVSPDGRLVGAAAFTTGVVTLRDARTGAVVRTLEPPAPRETAWAAFSPDGRLFLTGTQRPAGPSSLKGGYVEVWDVRSGRLVLSLHQPGDNGVSTAVVGPDGRRLLSVGNGGSVAVWSVPGGRLLRAWRTTDAYTVDGVFAPSERLVATGGYGGGLISLWNPRTAATGHDLRPPITSAGTVYPAGFFDGGRRLLVAQGASAESVQLWQLAGRSLLAALPIAGRAGVTPGAAITPDGRTLLTESTPGILAAWPLTPRAWVADACAIAHSRLSPAAWRTYFAGVPYRATC
jgi:WD40 repeat protein